MMFDSNSPDNPDGLDTYEHLFLSGQQVVETREGSGSTAAQAESLQPKYQNIWSPRYIDALILRDENTDQDDTCDDDRVYYLADANFNVTALVNTSGTVVERYLYTPYGEVTVLDGDFSSDADAESDYNNTTLYTGRTFDPAIGLYYYRHRVYHAQLGRFVSRDPIGAAGSNENIYQYAGSLPLGRTDPNGLKFVGMGMSCTPCIQPFMKCTWLNGAFYSVCIGSVSATALLELGGCAAFCLWAGATGYGYSACIVGCQAAVSGVTFLLTMPHCNLAYQEGKMKCGNEYNQCSYNHPKDPCCGPGFENWRPD